MGIQALVHGEELDVLMYLFQRLLRIGNDTGPLNELIDSQRMFCDEAVKEAQLALHPQGDRVFIPAERKSDEPSGD